MSALFEFLGSSFPRLSRIQYRISSEYEQALRLQPNGGANRRPTVLFVGNSLLLEGIDLPRLKDELAPSYHVARFVVDNTVYIDWYYGLKRLFARGARPSIVVVCLNSYHLTRTRPPRGEYFAHYLMNTSDVFHVVKDAHLDATTASNYLFASKSGWLGSKAEFRNWALEELFPDLHRLTGMLVPRAQWSMPEDEYERVVGRHLLALKKICDQYGSRLIILLPPTLDAHDRGAIAQRLGEQIGVPVLIPIKPAEMPVTYYRDGFHLNAQGAKIFTEDVVRAFREIPVRIAQQQPTSSGAAITKTEAQGLP